MRCVDDQVGRSPQYDEFADEFRGHAESSLYNAYYDRPACLELLGDVTGKLVLDAACGPGLYAAELLRRGARVTGFDQSPRMIEICRELPGAGAGDFRVHDLGDPLAWLPGASVDLALCALAIEYVDDRVAALSELRRVLRPEGALVLSRNHPTADWLRHGGGYYDVRVISETWRKGWNVRYWQAPLEVACAEFAAAGFVIERLIEPCPVPDDARADPAGHYERLRREPGFIAFRLRPWGGT
jgi:SAM-dependent methyltransferase